MRMIFLVAGIIFVLALNRPCSAAEDVGRDASEFENSIIVLSATRANPDSDAPWNIQNIDVTGFIGVVLSPDKILAPATLVTRSVFIQGQMTDEVTKIPLRVLFVDYEANLAVLTPVDGPLTGVKPLAIGEDLPLNSDVWMVGIENDKQLMRASVRVVEVAMREVIPGGQALLSYVLTSQSQTVCRGEPLIRQGKLAGICLGVNENQPWAHTAATLRHFMQDQLDERTYRGFPVLGVNYGVVKSPYQKSDMRWPVGTRGLRIIKVHETSAFADDLKPDDVLTGIDQHQLDNRGFFRHPVWGAISARHYISQRYGGEKVTLHYLRADKAMQATRPLRRYNGQDNRLPGLTFEGEIAHLIIGGLVFRELGVDFLSSFGRDWARYAPANLLHIFHFQNHPLLSRRRYLVLSQVLADSFNQGYDKEGGLILEKVNGDTVANLDELRLTALARPVSHLGEKFLVFEFAHGIKVVLPYDGLKEAQARIAKAYGISSPKSFLN